MHEVIAPAGRILHSDIAIEHRKEKPGDPDRNLRIYQAMVDRGEALEPRAQYYYCLLYTSIHRVVDGHEVIQLGDGARVVGIVYRAAHAFRVVV